ncbi:MAG TPA: ATP-binding cassette domain-containing protein [Facklamia tabacinasalis]|nr:ATP-binding cassette domain-containing protein [Ruoffia tabacinasalis]
METILSVKNLKKSYKNIEAVKDVSLDVKRGQLFAFLGPNGAGKSTTIDMLCTLLKPDDGEIVIDGFKIGKDDSEIKKSIGVVFQDNLLDSTLTIQENLAIRGSLYGLKKKELQEMINNAVKATGIEDLLGRQYGKLSGGQRRRADIARGLLHRPKILFLDEPTTGLDPQTRRNVWETLSTIQSETDMTIFLTTHYMEEAAEADYIAIIDHGLIVAEGTPAQLKHHHTSDTIHMDAKNLKQVEEILNQFNYPYSIEKNIVTVSVSTTIEAVPVLEVCKDSINSFEVRTGTLDDAFIAITGKEIRG